MRSMGTSLPRRPVNREGAANVSATTDGVECRRLQSLDVGGLKVAGGPAEVERARSRPRELTQGGRVATGRPLAVCSRTYPVARDLNIQNPSTTRESLDG